MNKKRQNEKRERVKKKKIGNNKNIIYFLAIILFLIVIYFIYFQERIFVKEKLEGELGALKFFSEDEITKINFGVYINDSLNKVYENLTRNHFSELLADGVFENVGYSQTIQLGSYPRLVFKKQPTSSNDPELGLELSTNTSNYIYKLYTKFNRAINFTDPNLQGKNITLFSRVFNMSSNTNKTQLVLSGEDEIILRNGYNVISNGLNISGTSVSLIGGIESLEQIEINVVADNSDKDVIKKDISFSDPLFKTFKINLENFNIESDSTNNREIIDITNIGNDKMSVNFTDWRNITKSIQFAKGFSDGRVELMVDADNRNLTVIEMDKITSQGYVVVGNESGGYLLKLTGVRNSSSLGSNNTDQDRVEFTDVFTGDVYRTIWISDGFGNVSIGGKSYGVYLTGNHANATEEYQVRLDYPSSNGFNNTIAYPTIQTSLGAKLMFYEPLEINLSNWDGRGNKLSRLIIPNGSGYSETFFEKNTANQTWDISGAGVGQLNTSHTGSTVDLKIGQLDFILSGSGIQDTAKLYLKSIGVEITNPALLVIEEGDDNNEHNALIVGLEEGSSMDDGIGVGEIERTWGNDNLDLDDWEQVLATNSKFMKEIDRYGNIITYNKTDSDQVTAKISYPNNQVYANISINYIAKEEFSTGGSGGDGGGGGSGGGGGGGGGSGGSDNGGGGGIVQKQKKQIPNITIDKKEEMIKLESEKKLDEEIKPQEKKIFPIVIFIMLLAILIVLILIIIYFVLNKRK